MNGECWLRNGEAVHNANCIELRQLGVLVGAVAVNVHHRTDFAAYCDQTPFVKDVVRISYHFHHLEGDIMSDTKSHPSCEHHHLAAARHVAAAYHHLQAVAEHDKTYSAGAKTHCDAAHKDSGAALKHSTTAVEHSRK